VGDRAVTPDYGSPTWRLLEGRLAAWIADLRLENDSPKLDAISTAFLRGQIRALNDVMNLPKSDMKRPIEPDPYETA